MVEVKKRRGESFESLMRRFQGKIRESGKALQVKKIRFYKPPANKNQRRKSAIERSRRRQVREYLIKIGKLKEETNIKKR